MCSKNCIVVLTWTIQVILGLAIPVACITVAAIHHDQCPAEPMINIYLYVAGVLGFVSFAYAIMFVCCAQKQQCCFKNETCALCNSCAFIVIEVIIALFMFAWFIAGSVWVYRNYKTYQAGQLDCDKTLYLFAFSIITIQWICFVLKQILSCFSRRDED